MEKLFICLANSKKYTQRCIAGIELIRSARQGYRYEIVRRAGNPVWLRPISDSEHGQVAAELVDHINLLDIVAVEVTEAAPQGYQSENVLFDTSRLAVVERITPAETLLDKLLAVGEPILFGDKNKAIPVDKIGQVDHSLLLIKPTNFNLYYKPASIGSPQLRAIFRYGLAFYDLPITDIDFIDRYHQNPTILQGCEHIYLTISLGMAFNEQHYKLAAGVIYF